MWCNIFCTKLQTNWFTCYGDTYNSNLKRRMTLIRNAIKLLICEHICLCAVIHFVKFVIIWATVHAGFKSTKIAQTTIFSIQIYLHNMYTQLQKYIQNKVCNYRTIHSFYFFKHKSVDKRSWSIFKPRSNIFSLQ